MKKIKGVMVFVLLLIGSLFLSGCSGKKELEKTKEYLDLVEESFELLSDYSDDIYSNWYGAIYDDDFYGNINLAIASATLDHEDNIETLEENDEKLVKIYREIRDSKFSEEIRELKTAYDEFYDFVINVSGSFNTYSSSKENLKKELSRKIKALRDEI